MRTESTVFNGNSTLVLSESFLTDSRQTTWVSIPTVSGKPEVLGFDFEFGPEFVPIHSFTIKNNLPVVHTKIGNRIGNTLATQEGIPFKVGAMTYSLLFALTLVQTNLIRIEISVYDITGSKK